MTTKVIIDAEDFLEQLEDEFNKEVVFGVIDKDGRGSRVRSADGDLTLNQLFTILHEGSEAKNIPPRPIVDRLLESDQDYFIGLLEEYVIGRSKPDWETVGRLSAARLRIAFDQWQELGIAPNHPETIKRKGSQDPLVETGKLKAHINYAVKDKK